MKTLVAYYSNTGSNRYLAGKIAGTLNCDIEAIRPRLSSFPLLMIFSMAKRSPGIKSFKHKVDQYDRIILCGPIWMGVLISPLRNFIDKHINSIQKLYFASCCASTDAAKDKKFGHGLVFRSVKEILGDKCVACAAFPIDLVLPADKKENSNAIMKTRLSDDNFAGTIQERFDDFILNVVEGAEKNPCTDV